MLNPIVPMPTLGEPEEVFVAGDTPGAAGADLDHSCPITTSEVHAMAFINEIPSEETIVKYNLKAFASNKTLEDRYKRMWTVDHDRNFYLWGGYGGNPAFGEEMYGFFELYLNGSLYKVYLSIGEGSLSFKENPYRIRWDKVTGISAFRPGIHWKDLPHSARQVPDEPQPLLSGMTLNELLKILKEALSVRGAGVANRLIHNPIVVEFGF